MDDYVFICALGLEYVPHVLILLFGMRNISSPVRDRPVFGNTACGPVTGRGGGGRPGAGVNPFCFLNYSMSYVVPWFILICCGFMNMMMT